MVTEVTARRGKELRQHEIRELRELYNVSEQRASPFLFRVTKPAMSFMTSFLRHCHYPTVGGDTASISQHCFNTYTYMFCVAL